MIYELIIMFLAICGISLCKKIYNEKTKEGPLVCYLGADCEEVVRGRFSSFFGIGLEVFGGMYYLFILLSYIVFYSFNFYLEPIAILIVVILSGIAFLSSFVLTFIQAFIIKTWCSWCLISAGISTAIFILGIINVY